MNQPNFDNPTPAGSLDGKAKGKFLGITNTQYEIGANIAAFAGNIAIFSNGWTGNSGTRNWFEMTAGGLFFCTNLIMIFWRGENKNPIKGSGTLGMIGGIFMAVGALGKQHPVPQIIYSVIVSARCGLLLMDNQEKPGGYRAVNFLRRHKRELFGATGLPTRIPLLISGIVNYEPRAIIAAIAYIGHDTAMICGGRAHKRDGR